MISHPSYAVEPWALRETELDLDVLPQSESVFALSNGHVGWRGNLDEGEPHGLPGSYLNGVYELASAALRRGRLRLPGVGPDGHQRHQRQDHPAAGRRRAVRPALRTTPLPRAGARPARRAAAPDLRVDLTGGLHGPGALHPAGLLHRARDRRRSPTRWRPSTARSGSSCSPNWSPTSNCRAGNGDPRVAAALESPLDPEENYATACGCAWCTARARSGLRVAAAADHIVTARTRPRRSCESSDDVSRLTVTSVLDPGQTAAAGEARRLRLVGAPGRCPRCATRSTRRSRRPAAPAGQGLVRQQRAYLDDFWARADVEVDGDEEIQQAVRFALFHVLQAGARAEQRAIPAKGLTGSGYDGHTFWDTETFVLPLLTYTAPDAVAEALRWRQNTLPAARERARQLGLRGAAFPWRTIDGSECSAYWPAGTAAFHVNADIADAVVRYVAATGDDGSSARPASNCWWRPPGCGARWATTTTRAGFHIDGVTGPDEYSAIADDNIYTNLMAQANLRAAADAVERHPRQAAALGVDDEESAAWRDAADAMHTAVQRGTRGARAACRVHPAPALGLRRDRVPTSTR